MHGERVSRTVGGLLGVAALLWALSGAAHAAPGTSGRAGHAERAAGTLAASWSTTTDVPTTIPGPTTAPNGDEPAGQSATTEDEGSTLLLVLGIATLVVGALVGMAVVIRRRNDRGLGG